MKMTGVGETDICAQRALDIHLNEIGVQQETGIIRNELSVLSSFYRAMGTRLKEEGQGAVLPLSMLDAMHSWLARHADDPFGWTAFLPTLMGPRIIGASGYSPLYLSVSLRDAFKEWGERAVPIPPLEDTLGLGEHLRLRGERAEDKTFRAFQCKQLLYTLPSFHKLRDATVAEKASRWTSLRWGILGLAYALDDHLTS
jgi:hypothetical protein